jgi:hypothetical protein
MPDRRGAWRQPLPARRPGCVPVPDPALRGEADGTDRDEHDVEQQLQLGLGDTGAHYPASRGVIETPAAQATVHAQGGHARGA